MVLKRQSNEARDVLDEMNEKYGETTPKGRKKIVSFASETDSLNINRLSSGIISADIATGGGVPFGRVTGIIGPFSSGKTLMSLKYAISAQKHCRYCKKFLTEVTGDIVVNKKTGEVFDIRDFLDQSFPFWGNCAFVSKEYKRDGKLAFEDFLKGDVNRKLEEETRETARKNVIKLMKQNDLFFERDSVYSCPCGSGEPMNCFWLDAEGAWDSEWAKKLGLNLDGVAVAEPAAGEHAVDQLLYVIESGAYDLIVVDSLSHLVPIEDLDKSAEEHMKISGTALMINRFERKMASALLRRKDLSDPFRPNCTVLQLNHLIARIKSHSMDYGPSTTRPGGSAQSNTESLCLKMGNAKYDKNSQEDPRYAEISFETVKNKTFPPRKKASFNFWLKDAEGRVAGSTDEEREVVNLAIKAGIIEKQGKSSYKYVYKDYSFSSISNFFEETKKERELFSSLRKDTFEHYSGVSLA